MQLPASPVPAADDGQRLVRRSSGDRAALHIRRLIFDGVLRPGARVPQDDIAQTLGVSRIPIREALIALEREGWVTIELHRGAFINALSEQAVRDHYELYGLVYGFAAQRALERADDALLDRLEEIVGALPSDDDAIEMGRRAIEFHQTIVATAASPRLAVVLRAMSGLVPGNFFALVPGSFAVERHGLAAIFAAMRARDGEQAALEYRRMMAGQADHVVELFANRGLFAAPAA